MADSNESTPLLTNSASNLNPEDPQPDDSIEEIIEPYLRGLRWRQVLQAMLGFLPIFFEAQQTFVSIFTDAKPTWHCTQLGNTICNSDSNICQLPESAWRWDKPAYTSIISEWSLDCASNAIIEGLPTSSFFMGCLLAGFALFFIGDSFGRKKMLFFSSLTMSVASFCTAFSNNVWVYSALRFITGIGRAAIGTCALVLATESVGKEWQGKIGSVGFVVFTAGFLLLPAIAYSVRSYSWRVIYLVISIPGILYCILLQLFAYESPKWLLAQGREQEALAVLKAFAGPDIKGLNWNFPAVSAIQDQKLKGNRKQSFFRILMKSRALCRQFLLLLTTGFGIGLVYFGVALGVGNLDFDLYWGSAFNASLQIVTFLVVFFSVTKLKRRISLLALTMMSGVCCILMYTMVGKLKVLQVGLELLSFFSASTAYSLLLIYTAELFPISARNSAVAMVWQALMLGGVVCPVLTAAAGDNKVLSYGIFGISVIATGVLVVFLPETVGAKNPADAKNEQAEKQRTAA